MTPPIRIVVVILALTLFGLGLTELCGWRTTPPFAQSGVVPRTETPAPAGSENPAPPLRRSSDATSRAAIFEPEAQGACGDGVKQAREQCDDGNLDPFDGCESCATKPVVDLTCDECIDKYPDLARYDDEVCNADPLCQRVRQCVLRTGCFKLDFPAACYCGTDTRINGCVQEDFKPHGPCLEEILAAAGPDTPGHPKILQRYFDPTYPVGEAMMLADELSRRCSRACAFERLN